MGRTDQSSTNSIDNAINEPAEIRSQSNPSETPTEDQRLSAIDQEIIELSADLKRLQLQSYRLADQLTALSLSRYNLHSEREVQSIITKRVPSEATSPVTPRALNEDFHDSDVDIESSSVITNDIEASDIKTSASQDIRAFLKRASATSPEVVNATAVVVSNISDTHHHGSSSTTKTTNTKRNKGPLSIGTQVEVLNNYLGRRGVKGIITKVTPAYYYIKPNNNTAVFRRHHRNVRAVTHT